MMGSVGSTILGSNCFADVVLNCARNRRARIGAAITAVVKIAAVSGRLSFDRRT
jgi:hypothetical protein